MEIQCKHFSDFVGMGENTMFTKPNFYVETQIVLVGRLREKNGKQRNLHKSSYSFAISYYKFDITKSQELIKILIFSCM